MRNRASTLPGTIAADRLEWLRQVRAGEPGDALLLITGLREDDPHRWEIGVVHAWTETYSADGTQSVWLRFVKPNKRTDQERDTGEVRLDAETAFLLQAHVFYRGSLSLTWSASHHGGIPYHYPRVLLPGSPFRYPRLIADTPDGKLPQINPANWRDMRRRNFVRPITRAEATAKHGPQNKHRNWSRDRAIVASAGHFAPGYFDSPASFMDVLREVYALLDRRHPLGGITP